MVSLGLDLYDANFRSTIIPTFRSYPGRHYSNPQSEWGSHHQKTPGNLNTFQSARVYRCRKDGTSHLRIAKTNQFRL